MTKQPAPRKSLARRLGTGPALILATALGIVAVDAVTNHSLRNSFNRANPIKYWSQLNGIHPSRLLHVFDHKAPVQVKVAPPKPDIKVCDSYSPYPKDPKAACLILADQLEEHCNPDFKPGMPNQQRKLTWPGEGDPIGPDPTRIQAWKNCDRVNDFKGALSGKLTPEQITQSANEALGNVNSKLDVGKAGSVMPLINQDGGLRGLPIDDNPPDPQVAIPTPPADAQQPPAPIVRVNPNAVSARPAAKPPAATPQR